MTKLSEITDALAAEFDSEVVFHPAPPATISAPTVIVTPGDGFLGPTTVGLIEEEWDVLVCVATKDRGTAVDQMRELSLRVRRTALGVGALWRGASGPRKLQGVQAAAGTVLSVNTISFRYKPE